MARDSIDASKRDKVESVRIVPTKGQRRFALSWTSISVLIGLVGTIAAILSIPILQPYLSRSSVPSPDARAPTNPVVSLPTNETPGNGAAAKASEQAPAPSPGPSLAASGPATAPAKIVSSAAGSDVQTLPAASTAVAARAVEMDRSPSTAPIKAVLNNAFLDEHGGVKILVTLYAVDGEARAYAPHTIKGHIRNWSVTDMSAGSSCDTRNYYVEGLPAHNDGRNESLQEESKAVAASGTTFTAGFSCNPRAQAGDTVAVALEIMSVSPDNRLSRSSFNATVDLKNAR